ncbi:hypothetical protein [Novacetimonas hansenii]|uniref:hypothetical protein n=1 Tax=Novacetimonas hansenii TaxID=436 RepID=UPI0039E7965D
MTRLQTPPEIAEHLMTEPEARTFHFRKPGGGSAYWFNLTWICGKLILSGDFGDITLSCFPACATFAGAITWAVDAEFEYLMEKTGERRTYDEVRTLEDIIAWANAPVIEELNGTERRRDVLVEKDGRKRYEVIRTKLRNGYRHACQDYRRAVAAGTRDDCRTGLDETDPRRFTLQVPEDTALGKMEEMTGRAAPPSRRSDQAFCDGHKEGRKAQLHAPMTGEQRLAIAGERA